MCLLIKILAGMCLGGAFLVFRHLVDRRNDRWTVISTGWPYPPGYGTYNKKRNTLLDSGLSRESAEALCKQLNDTRRDKYAKTK